MQATAEILGSGLIAQGPCVERFERDVAAFFGLQGGVAVSSGTAALELAELRLFSAMVRDATSRGTGYACRH